MSEFPFDFDPTALEINQVEQVQKKVQQHSQSIDLSALDVDVESMIDGVELTGHAVKFIGKGVSRAVESSGIDFGLVYSAVETSAQVVGIVLETGVHVVGGVLEVGGSVVRVIFEVVIGIVGGIFEALGGLFN